MRTTGKHVLADVWLNEYELTAKTIKQEIENALKISKMSILDSKLHAFTPEAFTGVWLLAESHLSIHSFPERNYISLDCYTCGNEGDPMAAIQALLATLDVRVANIKQVERGEYV